jgi:hypothetical protein
MHGPGWPAWEPKWEFPIVVLDTIAMSLRPRKAEKWRKARTSGLAKWLPSGVSFKVIERTPHGYPKMDYSRMSEPAYTDTLLVPPYLRLMRAAPEATHDGFAWWLWPSQRLGEDKRDSAAAFFKVSTAFWLRTPAKRAQLICHEVGHCLGLDHRPAGWGTISAGIMGTGVRPDEHDIASLKEWYGL